MRVRYSSKVVDQPGKEKTRTPHKNTMVTLKDEGLIFFGISRVMRDPVTGELLDQFKAEKGKQIARNRAMKAVDEQMRVPEKGMNIHEFGLRGVVRERDITQLLEYFENVDQILFAKRVELNRARNERVKANGS